MRFARAHYYVDLFKRDDVVLVYKPEEAIQSVIRVLSGDIIVSEDIEEFLKVNNRATEDVAQTIVSC